MTENGQVNPAQAMADLDAYAVELDGLSKELSDIEKEREPARKLYDDYVDDFECNMFEDYEAGDGKWPGETVREKLARRTMPADIKDPHDVFERRRKRAERRIKDLETLIGARRSILSALKEEMAATR